MINNSDKQNVSTRGSSSAVTAEEDPFESTNMITNIYEITVIIGIQDLNLPTQRQ